MSLDIYHFQRFDDEDDRQTHKHSSCWAAQKIKSMTAMLDFSSHLQREHINNSSNQNILVCMTSIQNKEF